MKYRINKPKNIYEHPSWVKQMDAYDGRIIDLKEAPSSSNIRFEGWSFSHKWLTLISKNYIAPVKRNTNIRRY